MVPLLAAFVAAASWIQPPPGLSPTSHARIPRGDRPRQPRLGRPTQGRQGGRSATVFTGLRRDDSHPALLGVSSESRPAFVTYGRRELDVVFCSDVGRFTLALSSLNGICMVINA